MQLFRLRSLVLATALMAFTPLLIAEDANTAAPSSDILAQQKPLVPMLSQKRVLIPNTNQSASMSLYSNANIVVQLETGQFFILGEVELTSSEGGQFHFYTPAQGLVADLSIDASDDRKWYAWGSLKDIHFPLLSNKELNFDLFKVKQNRTPNARFLEGIVESSGAKLSLPWTVTLGRTDQAGVAVFLPPSTSTQLGKEYFVIKKTPFGVSELNFKLGKKHLFISKQSDDQGQKERQISVLMEYTPDNKLDMQRKEIAKIQMLKQEKDVTIKIQTYPYTSERQPSQYREIQLSYNFTQRAFSLAEDRMFELQGGDYALKSKQVLELGSGAASLSDIMADIQNNRDKIIGNQGVSIPAEIVDLVSLFDPSYQTGVLQEGFIKHIANFMIRETDEQYILRRDLLATGIQTVVLGQGFNPLLQFLDNFNNVFDTTMKVYDQKALLEFTVARHALVKKINGSEPTPAQQKEIPSISVSTGAPLVTPKDADKDDVPDAYEAIGDELEDKTAAVVESVAKSASIDLPVITSAKQSNNLSPQKESSPLASIRSIPQDYQVQIEKAKRPRFEAYRITP